MTLGTTSDGNATWTEHKGVWGIASNQADLASLAAAPYNNDNMATVPVTTGTAGTYAVEVVITTQTLYSGLLFRFVDVDNCWKVAADPTSACYWVVKRTAGVQSVFLALPVAPANGDILKVIAIGANHWYYVNGQLVGTVTDSYLSTATRVGLITGALGGRFDNFFANDAPVAPVQTAPTAPRTVVAVAGDARAPVSWLVPISTGGSPITGYTVTSSPGGLTASTSGLSATVTGLTNGTSYTFTVKATNAIGTSAASIPSGSVTPTAPSGGGTRDAWLWPFASDSPWNLPVGSGAVVAADSDPVNVSFLTLGSVNVNATNGWEIRLYLASNSDPNVTINGTTTFRMPTDATPGGQADGLLAVVDPTKTFDHEMWQAHVSGNTGTASQVTGQIDIRGSGWNCGGVGATNCSVIGGIIRKWECDALLIRHALCAAVGHDILRPRSSGGWIWPAASEDGSDSNYAGNVPQGAYFVIPSSVNVNSLGLSGLGLALAVCLQDFGLYINNGTNDGMMALFGEQTITSSQESALRAAANTCLSHLRWVSNNSPSAVNGGGTYPSALVAPGFT